MLAAIPLTLLQITHTAIPSLHTVASAIDAQTVLACWIAVAILAVFPSPARFAVACPAHGTDTASGAIIGASGQGTIDTAVAIITLADTMIACATSGANSTCHIGAGLDVAVLTSVARLAQAFATKAHSLLVAVVGAAHFCTILATIARHTFALGVKLASAVARALVQAYRHGAVTSAPLRIAFTFAIGAVST